MSSTADVTIRERFDAFDESDFTEWLACGFRLFYAQQRPADESNPIFSQPFAEFDSAHLLRNLPFDFAYFLIGRKESLLDDLEDIYERYVPDDKKVLFRRSLGRLLRQCVGDGQLPEEVASDVIYLMVKVRAHESLESLAPSIGRGRYGKDRAWLQYEAISVLKALLPSKEAIDGLQNLVTSPNFSASFSFDVLAALCRADPTNWIASFTMMSGYIDELMKQAQQRGPDFVAAIEKKKDTFASELTLSVPAYELVEQLPKLGRSNSTEDTYGKSAWLFQRLCSLIEVEELDSFSVDDDSVSVIIKVKAQPYRVVIAKWKADEYKVILSFQLQNDISRSLETYGSTSHSDQAADASFYIFTDDIRRRLSFILTKKDSDELLSECGETH